MTTQGSIVARHEPRTPPAAIIVVLAASLAGTLGSGCFGSGLRAWKAARQGTIEPVNSALHKQLPKAIETRDLSAAFALHRGATRGGSRWSDVDRGNGAFRERRLRWNGARGSVPVEAYYRSLFDLFPTVEDAEVRIHRILWTQLEDAGYPTDVRLIVRGRAASGARQVLDQRSRVWVRRDHDRWMIAKEAVISRELVTADSPSFVVATEAAGINDVHDAAGSPVFRIVGDQTLSSGAAVADVDGDGFEDVAMVSASRIALYLNDGTGRFTEATAASGLPAAVDIAGTGVVFFDAHNDGWPDLWVSGLRGDRFYRNVGGGRFIDATAQAGVGTGTWGSMPVVADYDRDGFLDVYVVRMGDHANGAPEPNWEAENGNAGTLYRNERNGTFVDVTRSAGLDKRVWGLAGAWADYDQDGDPDLYVGNEFGFNVLYQNQGDGTFADVAAEAGVLDRGAAMGVAWGDYDNDGDLDLFVSNMYANSRWALFHPAFPSPVPWYLRWVPRSSIERVIDELTRGNTLLRNDGDGTFTDVSEAAGIRDCQWAWGVAFLDYNNDGLLDVYNVNGLQSGPVLDDV